jgi:hypothetical protein
MICSPQRADCFHLPLPTMEMFFIGRSPVEFVVLPHLHPDLGQSPHPADQMNHDAVVARIGQRHVKLQIVRRKLARPHRRLANRRHQLSQPDAVMLVMAFSGHPDHIHLKGSPRLDYFGHRRPVEHQAQAAQAIHRMFIRPAHVVAGALPRPDRSDKCERPDGFSQRGSSHAQLFREFPFGRQLGSRLQTRN